MGSYKTDALMKIMFPIIRTMIKTNTWEKKTKQKKKHSINIFNTEIERLYYIYYILYILYLILICKLLKNFHGDAQYINSSFHNKLIMHLFIRKAY